MTKGLFEPIPPSGIPDNALVVHADKGWHAHILSGKCDFFEKLGQAAQAQGIATLLISAQEPDAPHPVQGPQKRIMVGPRRFQGPHIFHAFPAYITGFWYLDRKGYFWNSSMMTTPFDPAQVDPRAATAFFNRVSRWRIRQNISQRVQSPVTALPPADVAVFVQDIERYSDPVHYLTTKEMIRAAAGAVEGRVYVKPHPLMNADQKAWLAKLCARLSNATLTDASVHDIIRASAVIVSQNSAVGFEALMHRKPVITCAKTDYAAATLVSHTQAELRDNIRRAPAHFAAFPYEAYFYWFLGMHMYRPQDDNFAARAMQVIYG